MTLTNDLELSFWVWITDSFTALRNKNMPSGFVEGILGERLDGNSSFLKLDNIYLRGRSLEIEKVRMVKSRSDLA